MLSGIYKELFQRLTPVINPKRIFHDPLHTLAYGTDAIAPIKTLSAFSKKHPALEFKIGIVDGKVADTAMLTALAAMPSRDQLLTMFAAGLIEHVKNVAICLDLHSQNMEN